MITVTVEEDLHVSVTSALTFPDGQDDPSIVDLEELDNVLTMAIINARETIRDALERAFPDWTIVVEGL